VVRNSEAAPGPTGGVFTVQFSLDGLEFTALNGGPHFTFNEAVRSSCTARRSRRSTTTGTRCSAGGQPSQCGWLKDRFGLSWQIVPTVLLELIGDPDPQRAQRATAAMMKMVKLDIETLRRRGRR
jgi:predicted 3-demethylubiquinone-9 3-methyltransferase (glyoxalase superfamily)